MRNIKIAQHEQRDMRGMVVIIIKTSKHIERKYISRDTEQIKETDREIHKEKYQHKQRKERSRKSDGSDRVRELENDKKRETYRKKIY